MSAEHLILLSADGEVGVHLLARLECSRMSGGSL
jgi:hypothetical protein